MQVKQIMTRKIGACSATDTTSFAAGIMKERDCGFVPVSDGGRLAGVITDRDICMAAFERGVALAQLKVASAMTSNVLTCSPEDTLERAEEIMRAGHVRRLPVVSTDGQLAGVVSLHDIALAVVRAEGEELLRGTPSEAHVARTLAAIAGHRVVAAP